MQKEHTISHLMDKIRTNEMLFSAGTENSAPPRRDQLIIPVEGGSM